MINYTTVPWVTGSTACHQGCGVRRCEIQLVPPNGRSWRIPAVSSGGPLRAEKWRVVACVVC